MPRFTDSNASDPVCCENHQRQDRNKEDMETDREMVHKLWLEEEGDGMTSWHGKVPSNNAWFKRVNGNSAGSSQTAPYRHTNR